LPLYTKGNAVRAIHDVYTQNGEFASRSFTQLREAIARHSSPITDIHKMLRLTDDSRFACSP